MEDHSPEEEYPSPGHPANPSAATSSDLKPDFFEELFGRLEDPLFVKNNKHEWIYVNDAFKELIGVEDLVGKCDADLMPPDQVQKFYEGDDFVVNTKTTLTQEEQIGEDCYALVKKIPIQLPDDSTGVFGVIFDISEYRKTQLEVEKLRLAKEQSLTDPLTGLANRRHLEDYFERLLEQNRGRKSAVGVMHIDLDYFKEINDTRGHAAGDAVLAQLSEILCECATVNDFVARIGGDEFVVVSNSTSHPTMELLAKSILAALAEPLQVEDEQLTLSVSIGISVDDTGSDLHHMLKSADIALYRAKNSGRGRVQQFSLNLLQDHEEQRRKRDDFRRAIDEAQFFPVYQPQFDTQTLEISGIEALARWRHPTLGVQPPSYFLDLATSEKCLVDLDRQILRSALENSRSLKNLGVEIPTMSVNVSAQSMATSEFVDFLESQGPLPGGICFELVESMLLDEPSGVVADNLMRLHNLGVALDIDDFGSGHASLLGLLEAKPDRINIDKRLVIPMLESARHCALVKSVIQIAESLDMDTIAEGVESEEHRQLLLRMGCRNIQGFGFARPMLMDDLEAFLLRKAA